MISGSSQGERYDAAPRSSCRLDSHWWCGVRYWDDATHEAYHRFNDARSDFMNATTATKLREAWAKGDNALVGVALGLLAEATREFRDHLEGLPS